MPNRALDWLKGFFRGAHYKVSDRYKDAVVVNQVNVRPINRRSRDIEEWQTALREAESTTQQRTNLFELYKDILLDGFLAEAIAKRVRSVTNRQLVFSVDGEEIDEVNTLVQTSFFQQLIKEIMHARFWGHSLCELSWPAPGSDYRGWTKLVDRRHVKPRFGIVTKQSWGVEGIAYREDPYAENVIEVGEDEDLGLILQACQYVIYKRGDFGDWAEFAEVFGMPFRHAKYNNEQTR